MSKTHWKKLANPDYLGAYALDPGKDKVLTVKSVSEENIVGADGKKEDCIIVRFREPVKPMILNATNAKSIQKLAKSPYIEDWVGMRIQLYAAKIKAFGEVVEALRIREFLPKDEPSNKPPKCSDCGAEIEAFDDKHDASYMAGYTQKHYGKPLCAACAAKRKAKAESGKPINPLETETGKDNLL